MTLQTLNLPKDTKATTEFLVRLEYAPVDPISGQSNVSLILTVKSVSTFWI